MSNSEREPLDDLLRANPKIVAELGPLIGFLSIIYDTTLPREFESLNMSVMESGSLYAESINDSM